MKLIGNESANKLWEWSIQSDDLIEADADEYVSVDFVFVCFCSYCQFDFLLYLYFGEIISVVCRSASLICACSLQM